MIWFIVEENGWSKDGAAGKQMLLCPSNYKNIMNHCILQYFKCRGNILIWNEWRKYDLFLEIQSPQSSSGVVIVFARAMIKLWSELRPIYTDWFGGRIGWNLICSLSSKFPNNRVLFIWRVYCLYSPYFTDNTTNRRIIQRMDRNALSVIFDPSLLREGIGCRWL